MSDRPTCRCTGSPDGVWIDVTDKNRPRFDELRGLTGDRLVEALRKAVTIAADCEPHLQPCPLSAAAADEIERLRGKLKEATP